MRAGTLDRTIYLLRQGAAVDDGFTTRPGPWAVLAKAPASYEPVSDAEKVRAQQVGTTYAARFQVRWSPVTASLGPEDQILFDGRRHDIVGKKEVGRRVGFEITATAESRQLTADEIEALIGEAP
jgi:hypothetical protein